MLDINFNESWNELDKLNERYTPSESKQVNARLASWQLRSWTDMGEIASYFHRVNAGGSDRIVIRLDDIDSARDCAKHPTQIDELEGIFELMTRSKFDRQGTNDDKKSPTTRIATFIKTYYAENKLLKFLQKHFTSYEFRYGGWSCEYGSEHELFYTGYGTPGTPDILSSDERLSIEIKHINDIKQDYYDAPIVFIYDDDLNLTAVKTTPTFENNDLANTFYSELQKFIADHSATDRVTLLEEGIDPTTKFDKPWDLDKIPDQDFIDAGLDKKDYIDQAWAAWRNKKLGNIEYVSKAASNETIRKKAEDDYNYALKKLGAVRRFPNRYGRGSYDAPEGVFDLDNFHVAFDKWFEDHGLMKLFDKEGKLKMKGSWGDISKLDKNEAPVKALIDLWRAQYSGGKTFKSAWDAEQQKKQAEEQAAKVRKDWEDQEDKDAKDLEEEIKKAILNSVDWINLKKVYASNSKEAASKLDVDVEVWPRSYNEDQTKIRDSRVVKIWFKNMIGPDTDQFEALCAPDVDNLKISDSVDVIVKQLNSVLTDLADAYNYLAELGSSWIAFTRSKTYEALGDDWRLIMFFNPADKKFYKITKKRVVSMSKDRSNSWSYSNIKSSYDDIPYIFLTYEIDGETRNYDVDYDISWEPVYACIRFSSDGNGNYKHWESAESEYVFNLKYGTDILDKAGMRFYKNFPGPVEHCEVEDAVAPYNIAFEKSSKYSYFLDSSD